MRKTEIKRETIRILTEREQREVVGGWPSQQPYTTGCTTGSGAGSIYDCPTARCLTL